MNNIQEYIKDGITINKLKNGGYEVFTIPTQHFKIEDLSELTPETFKKAIKKQEELRFMENKMSGDMFKDTEEDKLRIFKILEEWLLTDGTNLNQWLRINNGK